MIFVKSGAKVRVFRQGRSRYCALGERCAEGFTKADDAERAKLRDTVNKEVAEELQQAAKAGTGADTGAQALVNNGYNLMLQGQSDADLAMIEQGVAGSHEVSRRVE